MRQLMKHSDYVVYVDESGDHSLQSIDPDYPVFVLAFCIFKIQDYVQTITPSIQDLKFKFFGHDMVILHEREIRKRAGEFHILMNRTVRNQFIGDLSNIVAIADFRIVATAIIKHKYLERHSSDSNIYDIAMKFGLERIHEFLKSAGQENYSTFFVFESRGKKEDDELELEFRRVCDGKNHRGERFPFEIVIANKQINSSGLQFADLVARPIGRKQIIPEQPNRAYDILEIKLHRNSDGEILDHGLKVYP